MSVKLGPIIIGVRSIEKSREFYEKVFDFKSSEESPHYLAWHISETFIEIEEDSHHRLPYWAEGNIGTYKNSEFLVDDIENFIKKVVTYGGSILTPPRAMPWWGKNAEIEDMDKNIFLISQK